MASETDERRITAWIGQGVIVDGRITSAQDLRIDGKVDGTIEVGNHGLIIGASAAVKANLVAKSVVISGAVNGNVTASERVDLNATGSVEGDITSPRLIMADGAFVKGKVNAAGRKAEKKPAEEAEAATNP
jgi:cytoskeletal protein CcmA (bactofilin family)